jgi:hypothetical protein
LYYLFKGEKELFKDTWIYDKWDFKPYPVISISMTMVEAKNPDTITQDLKAMLLRIYREYGLEPPCRVIRPEEMLTAYEIEQAPPQNFLAQSGYLTFKEDDPERGYRLDYPNREVRNNMSELILLGSYK